MSKQQQPAFPTKQLNSDGIGGHYETTIPGMALLDYFAAQYVSSAAGLLDEYNNSTVSLDILAYKAYEFAEAMIREKNRRESVKP